MKIIIWLFVFLSIPLLAFSAAKQPSSISLIKETGKAFAGTGIALIIIALLRFPVKHYLRSNHSKQHSFLRNTSQQIVKHHKFFAIVACILLIGHGLSISLSVTYLTIRMALGSIAILLFFLTSLFGYLLTKRRAEKYILYHLHITFLLLALSTSIIHIKYKVFSWLF